ncbi:MAG: hypothetical protein IJS15_13685, partial [Victivallales bacterium]|nr:hypothetical protein [Victivallales bacterium]
YGHVLDAELVGYHAQHVVFGHDGRRHQHVQRCFVAFAHRLGGNVELLVGHIALLPQELQNIFSV